MSTPHPLVGHRVYENTLGVDYSKKERPFLGYFVALMPAAYNDLYPRLIVVTDNGQFVGHRYYDCSISPESVAAFRTGVFWSENANTEIHRSRADRIGGYDEPEVNSRGFILTSFTGEVPKGRSRWEVGVGSNAAFIWVAGGDTREECLTNFRALVAARAFRSSIRSG